MANKIATSQKVLYGTAITFTVISLASGVALAIFTAVRGPLVTKQFLLKEIYKINVWQGSASLGGIVIITDIWAAVVFYKQKKQVPEKIQEQENQEPPPPPKKEQQKQESVQGIDGELPLPVQEDDEQAQYKRACMALFLQRKKELSTKEEYAEKNTLLRFDQYLQKEYDKLTSKLLKLYQKRLISSYHYSLASNNFEIIKNDLQSILPSYNAAIAALNQQARQRNQELAGMSKEKNRLKPITLQEEGNQLEELINDINARIYLIEHRNKLEQNPELLLALDQAINNILELDVAKSDEPRQFPLLSLEITNERLATLCVAMGNIANLDLTVPRVASLNKLYNNLKIYFFHLSSILNNINEAQQIHFATAQSNMLLFAQYLQREFTEVNSIEGQREPHFTDHYEEYIPELFEEID